MAIYTALVLFVPLAILVGAWEGGKALYYKAVKAIEWHRMRKEYYPRRKVWMM